MILFLCRILLFVTFAGLVASCAGLSGGYTRTHTTAYHCEEGGDCKRVGGWTCVSYADGSSTCVIDNVNLP